MKIKHILPFFGFFLFIHPGLGSELDCPGSLKPRLPVVSLNPEVILREGEKHSFGIILQRGEKIPALEDGSYVFILDQDQNLVFSLRFPDLDEANPVVTHRSLYRKLEETLEEEPKLIALGEIHVDHGLISSVNNKAGTAFVPNESLPEMVQVLKERGLPVAPETRITPYDRVQNGHDREHKSARYRIQVERDPRLKALSEKLKAFRAEAYARFPSTETPGSVNWRAFLFSPDGPENHLKMRTLEKHQRALLSSFGWMENMNDRYRVLPILDGSMPPEKLEELIRDLPRFEGAFYGL